MKAAKNNSSAMQKFLSRETPQERLISIGTQFVAATDKTAAIDASKQAIRFMTTNSNSVNLPLREEKYSDDLLNFRDAVDYWIQQAPDYGQPRQVDRRVNFSPEFLEEIINIGVLTDNAFTATTKADQDPRAVHPFRNTLLHIDSKWSAHVNDLSPNAHFQEHLLPSNAQFKVVKGHLEKQDLGEDMSGVYPVKAEIWLEQMQPSAERQVPDPWLGVSQARRQESVAIAQEVAQLKTLREARNDQIESREGERSRDREREGRGGL